MNVEPYDPKKHNGMKVLEVHSGFDEDSGIAFKYLAPVKNMESVDASLEGYYWVEVKENEENANW